MKRFCYTHEMKQFIADNCKGISSQELTDRFNAEFGTEITRKKINSFKTRNGLSGGIKGGQFSKGHIPANKGKKITKETYEKIKPTMFKKGHQANTRQIGSERVNVDGYVEVKVDNVRKWRLKHNVVYEQHYGKIPKGCVVIMLDGNKQNTDISNLKMITRSQLLIMNRQKLFGGSKELTELGTVVSEMIDAKYKARERKKRKGEKRCQ